MSKFNLPDDFVSVFDREWCVEDDYGYSEAHVEVLSNGTDYYWRSTYGGEFGNANGFDQAKLAGVPDLERGKEATVGGSLSCDWVPNPGNKGAQESFAKDMFGVGFVPGTYVDSL